MIGGGEGQASKQGPNSRKGKAQALAPYSTRFLAPFAGSFEPTKEGYFSLAVRAETSKRASTPSSVKLCACALRLALAIASARLLPFGWSHIEGSKFPTRIACFHFAHPRSVRSLRFCMSEIEDPSMLLIDSGQGGIPKV